MSPKASTELSESSQSPSSSSAPWWKAPERLIAVLGALGLRLADRLSEDWTAAVLLAALGAPVAQWLMRLRRK